MPAQSSTDCLILSNPSQKAVTGSLALSSASASRRIPLDIGPGQTKRIDLRQALGSSSIGAMGGLTLTLPGHESLSATQIIFDEVTGLAATMKLFNRDPDDQAKNHALLAPMMALSQPDPGLGFPSGTTLIPRIFLRNAAVGSTRVSITIDWRSAGKSGELVPSPLDLPPGEVKVINLADYQKSGQMPVDAAWATVKLGYTGRGADLVPVAVSYDNDNRYGLQTPFSEGIAHMWAGGMWHVDPTHNTFITTGNGGSESTTAEATLFYNGGKGRYRIEKMLPPGQQLWLDVGRLIRDQVPDSDGHTLPPDTMTGSYELRDLDHATVGLLYEGKLVIDKTYGHAAYGCGSCCGYTTPELVPDPYTGPPGLDYTEVMQCIEQCSGDTVDVAESASGWQSSNTAVATLPNITLHTVAVGNATGSATIQLEATHPAPICPTRDYGPTQPVNVCDFTISPASFTSKDCSNGTEQSQGFSTNFSPSSCVNQYSGGGTCSATSTPNVDIAVGGVTCSFSSLVPPSATVQYFSGPELPNGTAGTVNMSFTVGFTTGSVSHTDAATVACP